MPDVEPVPDCLTIEEGARVLRLSRTTGYEQARVFRETGGKAGLPNFEVGGSFRVPTSALERMLGRPITHIPPARRAGATRPETKPTERPGEPGETGQVRQLRPRQTRRQHPGAGGEQGALPL